MTGKLGMDSTSRDFVNDDAAIGKKNEASFIDVWNGFSCLFLDLLTLASEPDGSDPPCHIPCHTLQVCLCFFFSLYEILLQYLSSPDLININTSWQ